MGRFKARKRSLLRRVQIEDRVQVHSLQQACQARRRAKKLDLTAGLPHLAVGLSQATQPGAIDVGHAGQIDGQLANALTKKILYSTVEALGRDSSN